MGFPRVLYSAPFLSASDPCGVQCIHYDLPVTDSSTAKTPTMRPITSEQCIFKSRTVYVDSVRVSLTYCISEHQWTSMAQKQKTSYSCFRTHSKLVFPLDLSLIITADLDTQVFKNLRAAICPKTLSRTPDLWRSGR